LDTKLKLYAGIEYLRPFEGEKQMIFFSGMEGGGMVTVSHYIPDGRGGRTFDNDPISHRHGRCDVAQRASDARVIVNLIATNGTARRGGGGGDAAGRELVERTGGYYTSLEMAPKAVAKVDALTRFSYLLGYTPSNPDLDGTFRDVQVVVNRPDLTVRFRHGYFAAPEPPPLELEAMVKQARMETALAYDQQATDIPLRATVSMLPRMGIQAQVRVEVTIDVTPLTWP
jgi:hypothetical protein